jgi:DNA-3-methyladenine glycosylase II
VSHRIIETEKDLQEGTLALTAMCEHMAKAHQVAGEPPLRRRVGGFEGLARAIVGQQLSVASASAIWSRLEELVAPFDATVFAGKSDDQLRGAGLSGGKVRTLRGIADAIAAKDLELEDLRDVSDETIHDRLTALKGIGPWTADIYLMFCLGRADAWAPGDLALQYAVADLLTLEGRPGPPEMVEIAERWRPWRAVAARMLWAYYRERKNAASGAPV